MAGQKPSQQSFQYPQFPHPQFPHPQSPHSRPQFPHPQFQQYGTPPRHQPQKQSPYPSEQYMRQIHEQFSHMYADAYAKMHAKMHETYLADIKKLLEQFVTVNRRNAEEAGVDAANAILQDQEVMRLLGPQNEGYDTQDALRKKETRALMEIVGNMSDKFGRLFEKFEEFNEPRVALAQQTQNSSGETVSTQIGVLIESFNDLRAAFEQQKQNSSVRLHLHVVGGKTQGTKWTPPREDRGALERDNARETGSPVLTHYTTHSVLFLLLLFCSSSSFSFSFSSSSPPLPFSPFVI
ncbi:hypothetical protein LZ31DRAFT_580362 [Colletotrichum somersetense]|nr:hypothetical protein LZ31DRAFT_580362 [Colletotrichum somersetense]